MSDNHLKPGAPDWSDLHLIQQIVPEDPRDQAQFRLPGDVRCAGNTFLAGIIPVARLVLPGHCGNEWIATTLKFAEYSMELRECLTEDWESQVDDKKTPIGFELEVDFGDMSLNELMAQLESKDISRCQPAHTMLKLVMHYSGKKSELISPPFRGLMVATEIDYIPNPPDPGHPWPYFECHSHWFREPLKKKNRRWFTKCFGSCPNSTCACNDAGDRRCWGLNTCWC